MLSNIKRLSRRKKWLKSKRLIYGSLICLSTTVFQEDILFATIVEKCEDNSSNQRKHREFQYMHFCFWIKAIFSLFTYHTSMNWVRKNKKMSLRRIFAQTWHAKCFYFSQLQTVIWSDEHKQFILLFNLFIILYCFCLLFTLFIILHVYHFNYLLHVLFIYYFLYLLLHLFITLIIKVSFFHAEAKRWTVILNLY